MDKAPFHIPVFQNDYIILLNVNIPPGRNTGKAYYVNGQEYRTPDGVRNNAKAIYKIDMIAQGYMGRPK